MRIQHLQAGIGDGPADRHGGIVGTGVFPGTDTHRRFGRAIQVVQAGLRKAFTHRVSQIHR